MQYEIGSAGVPYELMPNAGEVIEVVRRKHEKQPLPPFSLIGNGMSNKNGSSVDILEICINLNTAEMRLLQFFRDVFCLGVMNQEVNPNKVEPTKWPEFDKYLATALKKNYIHMAELGILVRLKRSVYLLNPSMFIPVRHFIEIKAIWEANKKDSDVI